MDKPLPALASTSVPTDMNLNAPMPTSHLHPDYPVHRRTGYEETERGTPPASLPDWLSAYSPDEQAAPDRKITKLPRYPTSPAHRELEQTTFEAMLETALDLIIEGKPIADYFANDPRQVSLGRFMTWVRKDKERSERFEEAKRIGSDVMAEQCIAISDGTDSMEDVQRSKLRIDTRKWSVQAWNPKRYGNEKEQASPFGAGGITINITAVESPYRAGDNATVVEAENIQID